MLDSVKPWIFAILFFLLAWTVLNNSVLWWTAKVLGGFIVSLYAAYFTTLFLYYQLPQKKVSPKDKAVFVTGCDSGFGFGLAERLDRFGFQVFAGCLNPDGDGARTLREKCTHRLCIVPLDVTSPESVQQAIKSIKENLGQGVLWAVVNNAGIGFPADVAWCNDDAYKKVYEVNSLGVVRVTRAVIPMLRKSKGRIVVVASIAGHGPLGGLTAYCMSKYATRAFTEGLRMELRDWNIGVTIIEPGFHRTNLTCSESFGSLSRNAWKSAPEEIKQCYPPKYIEEYVEDARQHELCCSPHVHDVLDALEDSVCVSQSNTQYRICMKKEWLSLFLVWMLPSSIAHMFGRHDANNNPFVNVEKFLGIYDWQKCEKCS